MDVPTTSNLKPKKKKPLYRQVLLSSCKHFGSLKPGRIKKRSKPIHQPAASSHGPRLVLSVLPFEILSSICSWFYFNTADADRVYAQQNLKSIGLTCKALRAAAEQWQFRHLYIHLNCLAPNLEKPLRYLMMVRDKRYHVRSVHIRARGAPKAMMQSVLKAMLGFLFESPSVTIWRLVLELPERHWDSVFKVALTGFTGNLKRLEILNSVLSARVAALCRYILSESPLCRMVVYAYGGSPGDEGDLVDGHEDPLLQHQLISTKSAGVLEHLSYVQVDDRIPFEWRFEPSFVLGLRCLEIDPVNIEDVSIIFKSSNPMQNQITRFVVWTDNSDTGELLTNIAREDQDPRSELGDMLSRCPNLREVDLLLPVRGRDYEAFRFSDFPAAVQRINLRFEDGLSLELEQWPDLLEGLSTWFSRCKDLQRVNVTFQDGCWSTALQELCDRDPICDLDADEIEALASDIRKFEPSLLRRYFWDEQEDEGPVQATPAWFDSPWLAPEALQESFQRDIIDYNKMMCQVHLRALKAMLSRRSIPYVFETPDFRDYWQLVHGDM
jgi:hypothetical protein